MVVLGGGVCKHQIANAMLIVNLRFCIHQLTLLKHFYQRNGADYSVFIVSRRTPNIQVSSNVYLSQNTGQEFDGSDSGARPDEAVSWGKIRAGAESVKVCLACLNFSCTQHCSFSRFSPTLRWFSPCWLQPHSHRMPTQYDIPGLANRDGYDIYVYYNSISNVTSTSTHKIKGICTYPN